MRACCAVTRLLRAVTRLLHLPNADRPKKSGRGYAELRFGCLLLFKSLYARSKTESAPVVCDRLATESGQDEKSGRGYAETAIRPPFALPKRGAPVDFF